MINKQDLKVFNTLSGKLEQFIPLHEDKVGMYVCGPTVYGEAHLGHARSAITFDIVARVLRFLGYNLTYVRNFTDVGHLAFDSDDGDDKVETKAKAMNKDPQEVAQYYERLYLESVDLLNCVRPNIMPLASGHIIEQIELVQQLLDQKLAYISAGSVYFDVKRFNDTVGRYGVLSHRNLEDTMDNSRDLSGQSDKHNPYDFALWKKAPKEHIMRWPSPWSIGFPGWHLECTAMGKKYLGDLPFDIHGGGMDLIFPHHDCEIAQSMGAYGRMPAKYWLHNNMITIEGKKMGKSYNNFITLTQMFSGEHPMLNQAYTPMTIRLFMLMAHYRSTLDFSNQALLSAQKALDRLFEAYGKIDALPISKDSSFNYTLALDNSYKAVCEDFNTPIMLAHLFEIVKHINSVFDQKETISQEDKSLLQTNFTIILNDILGLKAEQNDDSSKTIEGLMSLILSIRQNAKENKDYDTSDTIRNHLAEIGINLKDSKQGTTWTKNK